jgi:hypothetical protein
MARPHHAVQQRRPPHQFILMPDAPTRAATADSAPPWIAVARALQAPFGLHSRPVLDCVLQCSASVFFESFGLFSYGCWRCVGAGW